jgi:hypothetical protein
VGAIPLTVSRDTATPQAQSPASEDDQLPLLDYVPEGTLLHRVKVYGRPANYHYFDQFAEDAVRYAAMKPPAQAAPHPFFSYFPQYVQLGRRALAWYLYWRECVRRDSYPDTDYAYVLLYLFELINLPAESPETATPHRDLMAKVWMAYRRAFPQLDHYMCEWLCDYCLVHALPAPVELLSPALDDIIMGSRLKEFYLTAAVRVPADAAEGANEADTTARATAQILMRHCCQYDYRKSKFAAGEHKEMFDRIIPAAVAATLPLLLGEGGRKPAITMLDSTVTRDAFTGALCSYRYKRRVEVTYTSFSRSHELRFLIGDMVKHVENRLRGWIGVRSKLSVMSLPIPLRDALDAYLAPLAPAKNPVPVKKKDTPRPAYESLYDLPQKAVSLEDAAAIEADSWETTRILVEAFAEEDTPAPTAAPIVIPTAEPIPEPTTVPTVEPIPTPTVAPTAVATVSPIDEPIAPPPAVAPVATATPNGWPQVLTPYRTFLRAVLDGDTAAQRKAAAALGKMPDAVADAINSLTADPDLPDNPILDIILEDSGDGYAVIEDYREMVEDI